MRTQVRLFESWQLEGCYAGDLLYSLDAVRASACELRGEHNKVRREDVSAEGFDAESASLVLYGSFSVTALAVSSWAK